MYKSCGIIFYNTEVRKDLHRDSQRFITQFESLVMAVLTLLRKAAQRIHRDSQKIYYTLCESLCYSSCLSVE